MSYFSPFLVATSLIINMKLWFYLVNLIYLTHSLCLKPAVSCESNACKIDTEYSKPSHKKFAAMSCPEFKDKESCLSDEMNMKLEKLHYMIDRTWGNSARGCDICAANIKRLWCWLTSSPSQPEFLKPKLSDITVDGNVNYTAFVTPTLVHSLHDSCKSCHRNYHIPGTYSLETFMNFHGENSASLLSMLVEFVIEEKPESLDLNFASCDSNTTNLYGFSVKPCSCKTCEEACKDAYRPKDPVHNKNWPGIAFGYVCLGLFGILIILLPRILKKDDIKKD
ncbi:unnamed protein product [Blepharisma stoltei]|uniref:Niemann-Pick C1 N-terminal domain-containing protein n=1 Tax=Blepharisma stoltei TaxID=1481888 RepID=A0AAU9JGZ1_9CILI|nr:unnamed protein product [Blepharisma stoltei]